MDYADITFVILTRNEAANIAACIGSVPKGSPLLVYDACSDDATTQIAQSLGAIVVRQPWEGFVRTREAAAGLVTTPWTFMLDADERVPAELAGEIEQLQPARDVAGYSVPRRNHFCGRWIRSGGWWPDRLVRLIRTGQATLQGRGAADAVHETWQPKGICVALQSPIDHYSYGTITAYRRKFALYTALESKGRHGTLLGVIGAWLLVPVRFAWFWFRRGGIFEGWQGAYVCAGNAMYPAVVMLKSWNTSAPPERAGSGEG